MKKVNRFILLLLVSSVVNAGELLNTYTYPSIYPHITDAYFCRDPRPTEHLDTFISSFSQGDRPIDKAAIAFKIDLNADGYCEYMVSPPAIYVGTGGEWLDIYQYDGEKYKHIGDLAGTRFDIYDMKNGYVQIGYIKNIGVKSNGIYVKEVIYFDGDKYVSDENKKIFTSGYYRDLGVKYYKSKDYRSAEIAFENLYRSNGERNLNDANDLALTLIKQNRCREAMALLDKHLKNLKQENAQYVKAAKFNQSLCDSDNQ